MEVLSTVLFNAARIVFLVGFVLCLADRDGRLGTRAFLRAQARAAAYSLRRLAVWVYDHTVGWVVRRHVRWSAQCATRHLAWARGAFGRNQARAFPHSHTVWSAVSSWYYSRPLAVIAYVVKACLFLLLTVNVGVIVAKLVTGAASLWEESGKVAGPGGPAGDTTVEGGSNELLNPLATLFAVLRGGSEAIMEKASPYMLALTDPLGRPTEAMIGSVGIALSLMVLLALRVALIALWNLPHRAEQERVLHYVAPSPRFALIRSLLSLRVGANRRNRPVVILVNCLARVGAARKHHHLSVLNRIPLTAPRVHLADAENVVWSAWRTRHTAIRGVLRTRHQEHAADVVGALRVLEIRQDSAPDRGQVFDDMASMLTKITDRYAQGRTLALLDPEDLREVPRAINREWVRLVILGVVVVGAAVGASALGLSDSVIAQVVGVVSLVMVGLLYGARLAPTDLMDVVRGQSRA